MNEALINLNLPTKENKTQEITIPFLDNISWNKDTQYSVTGDWGCGVEIRYYSKESHAGKSIRI